MTWIREIEIKNIRGLSFNAKFMSGKAKNSVELKRINILTGCNGSFKTSILEALTASLLMLTDQSRTQSLFTVAMSLRMDDFWLYRLLSDGFELIIDNIRVKTAGIEDLAKVQQLIPMTPYTRGAIAEGNGKRGFLRVDVVQVSAFPQQVQYSMNLIVNKIEGVNYDFVSLSIPNPLTPQFVDSFMKLVDYAKAITLFNKVFEDLGVNFMGLKPDEFNRHNIVFVTKSGEKMLQYLGSGYLSLALMILAASRGMVIYDNVELHMHPWLMGKVAELMSITKDTQWIITTQSSEMLNTILDNTDLNEVLVIESNGRGLLRVYDGWEASRRIKELNEDLRGNCI